MGLVETNHLASSGVSNCSAANVTLTLTIALPNLPAVAVAYPVVLLSAAADKRVMVGGSALGLQSSDALVDGIDKRLAKQPRCKHAWLHSCHSWQSVG
jgi:hypothetical protein